VAVVLYTIKDAILGDPLIILLVSVRSKNQLQARRKLTHSTAREQFAKFIAVPAPTKLRMNKNFSLEKLPVPPRSLLSPLFTQLIQKLPTWSGLFISKLTELRLNTNWTPAAK